MKREMKQVAVHITDDGYIWLSQEDGMSSECQTIILSPEQTGLLSEWLSHASDEIYQREEADQE